MSRRGGGRSRSRSSLGSSLSRSRSSSSSSSRNTPAPVRQQQNLPAHPQQGGGGFLSNVAGGIFSGLTFGTGSAIAHRAVDGIMGPRTVEHVHTGGPEDQMQQQQQPMMQQPGQYNQQSMMQPMPPGPYHTAQPTQQPVDGPCASQVQNFRQCMDMNNNDIATCTPFMEALQQCQRQ